MFTNIFRDHKAWNYITVTLRKLIYSDVGKELTEKKLYFIINSQGKTETMYVKPFDVNWPTKDTLSDSPYFPVSDTFCPSSHSPIFLLYQKVGYKAKWHQISELEGI